MCSKSIETEAIFTKIDIISSSISSNFEFIAGQKTILIFSVITLIYLCASL